MTRPSRDQSPATTDDTPGLGQPLISVIVPIYNVAEHVAACVQSLRDQTWQSFEVIMVDDGSTDGSGELAARAAEDDPRFRLIRQQNRGLSGARNTGLEAVAGEFIAFVDSDDRVMPDYLMRLWHALQEVGGDWVACAVQSNFADGTGHAHSAIHGASDLTQHITARRYAFAEWSDVIKHFPSAWNKLYRRSLIDGLRFDEGTWFEDHGFFHRAAARTDHIVHLPEALYIQTRGREGQITGADSERVFEQFDVLAEMQRIFEAGPHTGAREALARIASRLVFERSTILADPDRRTRFAAAARDFLAARGLDYSPEWDRDIGRAWALEMAGILPLSVVLEWDGTDLEGLSRSLEALRGQTSPAHEVLLICHDAAASRALAQADIAMAPHWRALTAPHPGIGRAFNHGLEKARGRYVIFHLAGDAALPWALHDSVEAMLHADGDFGMGQMRLHDAATGEVSGHNGMHDMNLWPQDTLAYGAITVTPMQALGIEAHCSAKVFRRGFLQEVGAGFTQGARADWALSLIAALRARRSVYIAQALVTVEMRAGGFLRWHVPQGAADLRQSHAALLATVSTHLRDIALPPGWQRRLFARALREQVYFGKPSGRLARLSMVAGAAALSARLGYGAPQPAGLDPLVGPRLSRLMDPASVLLRRPVPVGPPEVFVPARGRTVPLPPPDLHPFAPTAAGIVQFQAMLHTQPFANIHFYAKDSHRVLFHLSLRRDEGLVVCNDQIEGGHWRTERRAPLGDTGSAVTVTLHFTPPRVRAKINDRTVFDFGARSVRARDGFADLARIAGFTLEGHVVAHHVIPQIPPGGSLMLDPRLMLRAGADVGRVAAQPGQTDVPMLDAPGDTRAAPLPAPMWRDVPPGGALTLTHAGGTLALTRERLAQRIEALLCTPLAVTDSTMCLSVLEHVRHAEIHTVLSSQAQRHLGRIAQFYGALPFLATPPEANPPPPPAPDDPVRTQVDIAVARLAQSQSGPAHTRPDALTVAAMMQVSPLAAQPLFLALTEYFCARERDFAGLHALARARDLFPLDIPPDRWSLSAALPFLAAEHDEDTLIATLQKLEPAGNDWLVTPAIAWAVRHVLTRRDTRLETARAVLDSFATLLRARASDYWDRAQCRELTRTAAAVIRDGAHLPEPLRAQAAALCVEVYGLSRVFWEDLAPVSDLPDDMWRARDAFTCLHDDAADPGDRLSALGLFERAGNADAPRLRRELYPLDTEAPEETQSEREVLRALARPGSPPPTPAQATRVRAALPPLYPETPQAPDLAQQQTASRCAQAWLRGGCEGHDSLTQALAPLTGADAHHLGMGMALALIDAAPDESAARALCDWFQREARALDGREWRCSPAVVAPLRRLRDRTDPPAWIAELLDGFLQIPTGELPASAEVEGVAQPFDTIVTVFSCARYLDTRIPALRAGWLTTLRALGIPYVIVVGDGDGTRRGDVVHLDAPDDYEGLPQKTLATLAWVTQNTRYGRMLKIDDDCFLNAALFFGTLSYAKFDYYGRRLHRLHGQTDRIWHQGKSATARGRLTLDKSPEPSEYADGGSGYTLSRTAMQAALDAAATPEGRALIDVSFMEDKMLGDLLAMRGIHVASEDYRVSIRRRSWSDALPVASWLNSFHASASAPLQLVHLDTHHDQASAQARLDTPALLPSKIWPGFQDVALGHNSNALELVSDTARVVAAQRAPVAVVACMRNEMFMLPQFLDHYRRLGVTAFLIADNGSDDGTLEYLAGQADVALFSVDTDYSASHYGVAWQQALLGAYRAGKWSLVADADELLVWQARQTQTLPDLLARPEFAEADAVRCFMLDMYPEGSLSRADFVGASPFDQAGFADRVPFVRATVGQGPNSSQPCWTSALRHRLIPGARPNLFVAQKLALLRYHPGMRLSAGLHFVGDVRLARRELILAHFKYNADFRRKAQAEVQRGQHFNDAEEYRKYLAMASEGRDVIFDKDLSLPWADVPFVKRRLAP
ncbi:glycosyltransferase [Sulfitobacter albidus]|uniref:Glycosyltransferase n=1 Tax=Sulfitobacter albidus TaxID=2829501 RepID=A0A975JCM1_9RHOB|nr:glycosyltransferase [Sulfitobacter albidus]QUJ76006.1 glycosyltransferase [Sulfitobacter albidus]